MKATGLLKIILSIHYRKKWRFCLVLCVRSILKNIQRNFIAEFAEKDGKNAENVSEHIKAAFLRKNSCSKRRLCKNHRIAGQNQFFRLSALTWVPGSFEKNMKLNVTEELLAIFQEISNENKSEYEWALIEADDMFQTEHFAGGFDATEMAFCFSFRDLDGKEYWFQSTSDEVAEILARGEGVVEARIPD